MTSITCKLISLHLDHSISGTNSSLPGRLAETAPLATAIKMTIQNWDSQCGHSAKQHARPRVTHLQNRVRPKIIIVLHLFSSGFCQLPLPRHQQLFHVLLDIVHLLSIPGPSAEALEQLTQPGSLRDCYTSLCHLRIQLTVTAGQAAQNVHKARDEGSRWGDVGDCGREREEGDVLLQGCGCRDRGSRKVEPGISLAQMLLPHLGVLLMSFADECNFWRRSYNHCILHIDDPSPCKCKQRCLFSNKTAVKGHCCIWIQREKCISQTKNGVS